jgi:hypothetical protein
LSSKKFIFLNQVDSNIKCPGKSGKKKGVPWVSVTMGLAELKATKGTMERKKA